MPHTTIDEPTLGGCGQRDGDAGVKTGIFAILAVCIWLAANPAAAEVQKLSGSDNGRPPPFTVEGPWTLDWTARSDSVDLASIELRLYDAKSGDFIGAIAEIKGTGNGLKLFENGGTYQLVVVGTLVKWDIEIEEISEELAGSMKRMAEEGPSSLDSVKKVSRLVPESSFESWRPLGDEQLLLFDEDRIAWRIFFSPPCPGLASATAVSFVMTADGTGVGQYDSILMDDGTRCYFVKAIPDILQ